ncbi:MAG: hypothetical protein ABSE05_15465 [Syntrophales bacterium]
MDVPVTKAKTYEELVSEYCKKGMGKTRAFQVVMEEYPDAFNDYLRRERAGEKIEFNLVR